MYLLGLLGCYKSMSTTCLHSYISIYSNLILFADSKHVLHFLDTMFKLQIQSKRLVTTSVSLCTQTGLHCLTIQVLNIRVCFMDFWYSSLTSEHINLEHGLAIVTKSFSPLDLDYTIPHISTYRLSNYIVIMAYFHQQRRRRIPTWIIVLSRFFHWCGDGFQSPY